MDLSIWQMFEILIDMKQITILKVSSKKGSYNNKYDK